jgi:ectoine hydroxylase
MRTLPKLFTRPKAVDAYPSRCGSEPRVLQRVDPVVHSRWHENAPLTRDQTLKFEADGFLILTDLFSPAEISAVRRASTRILSDPRSLFPETVIREPGSDEIRSVFMIHAQNEVMGCLAADERLAGIARFLLGDEVYVHQSRLNYKPGLFGKEFYWHSDFETWHVEDGMPQMRALSMSVLLAPNTELNGPLMIIPRSHRQFCSCAGETPEDNYLASLKKQEVGVPDPVTIAELAAGHGIATATGTPGTVVIFDCNAMHGSNGNITPYPRANAFFVYNAVSNRLVAPFGPAQPRPEFVAARKHTPVLRRPTRSLTDLP